ncbi:hypothetical protein Leryth_025176 [Lithospermum erythrorhizon]|nr:hypothetical protein Leryth_025176 [Lithospermum erythrorhizon]
MASGNKASHSNNSHMRQLSNNNINSGTCSSSSEAQLEPSSNNLKNQQKGESLVISKAIQQYTLDARLHAVFEQSGESGKSFDYSQSVRTTTNHSMIPELQMSSYLSKIQRGGHIQPFGCMLAVDETSFRLIAYSENALELLSLMPYSVPSIERQELLTIGIDVRTLFTPSSSALLERAFSAREITLLNPISIHSKTSLKPFYGILHRVDVGIVIDLEPARTEDPALSIAGAVQSQKLAIRAISHLQSLPGGDVKLCDARTNASRFLFKQNRVRMIVDCHATPVRVVQDESLMQPLILVGSTLRAPHGCHAQYMVNMGSIASLTLAVVINGNDEDAARGRNSMRLWGLVVGHHTSARYIPFPLRYACEFLMQVFGLQLNMELQLASQVAEKRVLRTQTLLCDMLLRESPTGIIMQSPSIMDLVKCNGAALYYQGKYYPLGVTPTEVQIRDIVEWLLASHGDSTGLSTDSLADAGILQEVVKSRSMPWENAEMDAIHSLQLILRDSFKNVEACNSKAVVQAQPEDMDIQGLDELTSVAREMVRLIETATAPIFAVDVQGRINGWNAKVSELTGLSVGDATGKELIHDLVHKESQEVTEKLLSHALRGEEDKNIEIKLRTFGSEAHKKTVFLVVNACSSKDYKQNIVGVCFVGQDVTGQKAMTDKFIRIEGDYKAIVHSLNPLIPPIFASDENTVCSEWNAAMDKITGWRRGEIIGKMIVGEIFGSHCRLKGPDVMTKFMIVLHKAIGGQDTDKFPFPFFDRNGKFVQALLTANKRVNVDGKIIGAFCFLQIASPELQRDLRVQRLQEKECFSRMKELAYICQEIKNPLSGIRFTNSLLENTDLTDDQKQLLETSAACERQVFKILKDVDRENVEDGSFELEKVEFYLGSVIDAVVSQVMLLLRERNLQLIRDIPEEIKILTVYGDQVRIQQVMADFLLNMVHYAESQEGWVELQLRPSLNQISDNIAIVHIDFRIVCPGQGLPPDLVQDMFNSSRWITQEGLGLSMCRKILKQMNGEVQYVRESERCYFLMTLDLPVPGGLSESAG